MVEEQKVSSSSIRKFEWIILSLCFKELFNNNSNTQFEFLPLGRLRGTTNEQTRIPIKFQSLD